MHTPQKPLLVSIVGPTAVGKTALAIKVAQYFETEILSADSRQFFRELNIGTAKPSSDELKTVIHHFINSHSIDEEYNAGSFERDVTGLLNSLFHKKKVVVAVGGSTLYLKALWEGFDKMPKITQGVREELNSELREKGLAILLEELQKYDPDYFELVDRKNGQRVIRALEVIRSSGKPFSFFRISNKKDLPYRNLKIGLNMEREILFDRINERMDRMISRGLFEEVESLLKYKDHHALQTVGYTEIFDYLRGDYGREEAIRLLKRNSRRYAKRQLTWFRKDEDIHWFEPGNEKDIIELIQNNF